MVLEASIDAVDSDLVVSMEVVVVPDERADSDVPVGVAVDWSSAGLVDESSVVVSVVAASAVVASVSWPTKLLESSGADSVPFAICDGSEAIEVTEVSGVKVISSASSAP